MKSENKDSLRLMRCKVWLVREYVGPSDKLHYPKHLDRLATCSFEVKVPGLHQTNPIKLAAASNGAVLGDILAFHPIGSKGEMVCGKNFKPQIIYYTEISQ